MLQLLRKFSPRAVNAYSTSHSTLHEEELDKFRVMASSWWDINGPFKALHSFNKLRVPFVRDGILAYQEQLNDSSPTPTPLSGFEILDVGCGGGLLSESLARLGANVTGIDPCAESIAVGEQRVQKFQLHNLTYKVDTIEGLKASSGGPFDAITASEVIEHVENPAFFVQTCVDLLKPGGSLFITTVNRTTASWMLAICAAEYLLHLIPKGTHDWNKFITPDELTTYAQTSGCRLRQLHGLSYNPLSNSWSWSSVKAVNYAVHVIKSKENLQSEQTLQTSQNVTGETSPVQDK